MCRDSFLFSNAKDFQIMKKQTLLIGVSIAAVAALVVYYLYDRRRDNQPYTYIMPAVGETSVAVETSRGLNLNLLLEKGKTGPEVIALQKMLQAYDSSVSVTGSFDEITRSALKTITGKSSINLYEFRYMNYVPKFGEARAIELFKSVTGGQ